MVLSRAGEREYRQDMGVDKGYSYQDDDSRRVSYQHSNENQYNFEVREATYSFFFIK